MQRQTLVLCAWLCLGLASLVYGQSVFEIAPNGNFLTPATMPDGSAWSSSGLSVPAGSQVTTPDRAVWTSAGLTFPAGATLRLPDQAGWTASGLTFPAPTSLRLPDNSLWNSGGLSMGTGKSLYADAGNNTSPGFAFTQQTTLGLYRFALDDMRVTVSGGLQAARFYLNGSTPQLQAPVGESTQFAPVGGVLCTSVTATSTTGLVAEVLASCALPANALPVNGKGVKVRAWGTTAANGNSKSFEILFGGTTCSTMTGNVNNGSINLEAIILRTGAATQECGGISTSSLGTAHSTRGTPAATLTGAVTIAARATTPTAAGDFTFRSMVVEVLN